MDQNHKKTRASTTHCGKASLSCSSLILDRDVHRIKKEQINRGLWERRLAGVFKFTLLLVDSKTQIRFIFYCSSVRIMYVPGIRFAALGNMSNNSVNVGRTKYRE